MYIHLLIYWFFYSCIYLCIHFFSFMKSIYRYLFNPWNEWECQFHPPSQSPWSAISPHSPLWGDPAVAATHPSAGRDRLASVGIITLLGSTTSKWQPHMGKTKTLSSMVLAWWTFRLDIINPLTTWYISYDVLLYIRPGLSKTPGHIVKQSRPSVPLGRTSANSLQTCSYFNSNFTKKA